MADVVDSFQPPAEDEGGGSRGLRGLATTGAVLGMLSLVGAAAAPWLCCLPAMVALPIGGFGAILGLMSARAWGDGVTRAYGGVAVASGVLGALLSLPWIAIAGWFTISLVLTESSRF